MLHANLRFIMSRPLRLEFSDALYHVAARGGRRENIFEDGQDRHAFLLILAQVVSTRPMQPSTESA
jgi:hypothetical protein